MDVGDKAAPEAEDGNVDAAVAYFSQTVWWPKTAFHSSASQSRSTHWGNHFNDDDAEDIGDNDDINKDFFLFFTK